MYWQEAPDGEDDPPARDDPPLHRSFVFIESHGRAEAEGTMERLDDVRARLADVRAGLADARARLFQEQRIRHELLQTRELLQTAQRYAPGSTTDGPVSWRVCSTAANTTSRCTRCDLPIPSGFLRLFRKHDSEDAEVRKTSSSFRFFF